MSDKWLSQSGSAGNAVYAKLKEQIVTLELPPGTTLSEKRCPSPFKLAVRPFEKASSDLRRKGWWLCCRNAARAYR